MCRTRCELSRVRIKRDCLELVLFVDIDGLDDMIRVVEDNKRIARDVGLDKSWVSPSLCLVLLYTGGVR
jgi:hypothetical protein